MHPLAYRMRPNSIDEIIGQEKLVGKGKIIRRMVESKLLSSMILYGPPGTGKTSIANAIAKTTHYNFYKLNAAIDSKKNFQEIIYKTDEHKPIILMLDEIHRLNKPNQDFLLSNLENGKIILIGATTENPYIAISPAIRSRVQIFKMQILSPSEIKIAMLRALDDKTNGLGNLNIKITNEAWEYFTKSTNGDLRSALNALELAAKSSTPDNNGIILINSKIAKECLQYKSQIYDKNGDSHYDVLSAFQKSIRGSDTNAAIHYLARLIKSGDLQSIIRRLMITAYEDIGLSNPKLTSYTYEACMVAEKVGIPEARIPLSVAVINLCLSPKSNSALIAIDKALNDINDNNYGQIPDWIKDNHYKGASKLHNGIGYKYPHDFPHSWVKQQYLPNKLKNKKYYYPKKNSKYEANLYERYSRILKAQKSE